MHYLCLVLFLFFFLRIIKKKKKTSSYYEQWLVQAVGPFQPSFFPLNILAIICNEQLTFRWEDTKIKIRAVQPGLRRPRARRS